MSERTSFVINIWVPCSLHRAGQNRIPMYAVNKTSRMGQNHVDIYSVHTVYLAGKSPNIRSYTVNTYSPGQPYKYRIKYIVLAYPKFEREEAVMFGMCHCCHSGLSPCLLCRLVWNVTLSAMCPIKSLSRQSTVHDAAHQPITKIKWLLELDGQDKSKETLLNNQTNCSSHNLSLPPIGRDVCDTDIWHLHVTSACNTCIGICVAAARFGKHSVNALSTSLEDLITYKTSLLGY
jgi:hypothetical protein